MQERYPVSCSNWVAVAWELHMPRTGWTPSLVPYGADQTAYLVIDPLADRPPFAAKPKSRGPTIIVDLMSGQFNGPTRVVAFNRLESIDRRTS